MTTDLLGTPLTRDETDILAVYAGLKSLLERDLAPAVAANLRDALASTGVVVTDLALDFEHLLDLGA
ncbi:hypothetical protein [Rathayibacter sp. VKM Ac-2760]|uniref:hypothetical protein n=1 Tax=Rathayibacter sp. VKM Ac-2760 TaxID=2609253 RepID=UPI00131932C9|nr:hypothetical protein [Rathayibacter sp. VKM Ac-2760]QHC60175.1 hypothetical protein GSU72_17685 [Rathayibacter sp. VKM Ac-2760]